MTDETWPRKVGNGWNTSDRMRFFNEEKAVTHQARVDDPDDEAGTHERAFVDDAPDNAPDEVSVDVSTGEDEL